MTTMMTPSSRRGEVVAVAATATRRDRPATMTTTTTTTRGGRRRSTSSTFASLAMAAVAAFVSVVSRPLPSSSSWSLFVMAATTTGDKVNVEKADTAAAASSSDVDVPAADENDDVDGKIEFRVFQTLPREPSSMTTYEFEDMVRTIRATKAMIFASPTAANSGGDDDAKARGGIMTPTTTAVWTISSCTSTCIPPRNVGSIS